MMSLALKEWAVVIRALHEGKQTLLLRKGGIAERGFQIKGDRFLLFPTYEHQSEDVLRSPFRNYLLETLPAQLPGKIRIADWAKIEDSFPIAGLRQLDWLYPHHVWAQEFVEAKQNWMKDRRPTVLVLVLRVFRLIKPQIVNDKPKYRGCRSWLEIDEQVDVSESTPALSEKDFAKKARALRDIADNLPL
jgi:hypothetical protein